MPPVGGSGELFIDTWLTNLSVDFLSGSDMFISDKVFPIVPVLRESGKYIIWDRGSFLRDELRERPLGGRADVADWSKSEDTYRVVERALAHKLDDRQRANADSQVNLDRAAMRKLVTAAAINNDLRWASAYFGTGIWTTDLDGATADFVQFDTTSAGIPSLEVQKAKNIIQKFGVDGDNFVIVIGIDAHTTMIENADMIDRIKYTQTGVMTNELIASMLGVKRYLVANSIYNTAAEPLAESIDYIVANPDDMLLVYAPDNPGLEVPSGGYTFAWTGLLGGSNAFGGVMQRGRDDFAHSDHFEIRTANDIKLVSADLGVYFENITA